MQRFGKVCKLTAFKPFSSAADALEQINAVSESVLTDDLKNFLTTNLPKVGERDSGSQRERTAELSSAEQHCG
jgi:nucleolar protein 56